MAFTVKYIQEVPKNCSDCPCSEHIETDFVFCNALKKYIVVQDERPKECTIKEKSE